MNVWRRTAGSRQSTGDAAMLLPLPASPETVLREVIPVAARYLPPAMRSDESDVELLAIGLQESELNDRRQGTVKRPGPARGLLQFEITGVRGVMKAAASRAHLQRVCAAREVPFDARAIHLKLEHDDVLAFILGRLLLWTDPRPLPAVGDLDGGFDYYVRNWRPGAAATLDGRRECLRRWRRNYPKAMDAIGHD